jgi:L-alanine-DL-glutamate epimerase-like enolase superfamily enzyme
VAVAPAWENNRAAAWLVTGGSSLPTHRHARDAVELIFDGASPNATFVPAGTVHVFDTQPMWKEIVTYDGPVVEKGFIRVSEKPGIGVDVNEEAMRKYAVPNVPFFA